MAAPAGRYWYREVLPLVMMVIVECTNVGNSTIFKVASETGMSNWVYLVYSFGISGLCLVPLAFFFHRKAELPPMSFQFYGRLGLLVLLGISGSLLGYKGIEYGSPTLYTAMSNLTPAFTFALAILFRMEKLVVRSLYTQAKIIGTIISIAGALVVVLYEGPPLIRISPHPANSLTNLTSKQSDWTLGGFLLTVDYLFISIWYIVQAQLVRIYPAEFLIVCIYNFTVALFSIPLCYFMEPDLKAWRMSSQTMLLAILYSGIVSSAFGVVVHTWNLKVKGPVYVASFRPLSIAIAAIMGVIFLGDTLFLGCVIGAVIISMGFYVVLWGKAQEDLNEDRRVGGIEEAPLLQ